MATASVCRLPSRSSGKEHDPETGNDYFGARYYSSTLGRFMTPDWAASPVPIPYANPANPQTLNLYGYVQNNPITGTDPDGHWDWNDVGNFVAGFGNAYGSDNLGGVGRMEQTTNAGRIGAAFGDAAATIQGTAETLSGLGTTGVGVATAPTGVGVAVAVVGVAEVAHGSVTASTGFVHLLSAATSDSGPTRKNGGATTEPTLPKKTVVEQDGVTVKHFTKSGDHGPAHLHVEGKGPSTKIGMNGKPIKGSSELSATQKSVVDANKSTIRSAVDKIQRWFKFDQK